ncbi:glycosyltransferase family 2 protein [Streptococcus sp. SPS1]|uniref:glycosyltransferase family 2 protein n=1 Tax=Streptococcus sp. SPS1 TaxID=3018247 RepID=UPI00263CC452|nr:glycosyltransferase family 2 protein [Streptococcus sp. SPS1]MDN5026920.1 glycosyltransferase family 2 protein [Streptococcus sp. SPS1]
MNDKELVNEDGKMLKLNDEDFLISIVIPIYNAEKYLEQCLNSIKNQTYKNFEVILVNDGSIDNSESICKAFVESDTRFRYYLKANGGVSSARNLGLDNVKGDFITFIDSDDWIAENHLELLINSIKKTNSDIVVSCYKEFDNNIDTYYTIVYTKQEKNLLNFEKMNRDDFLTIFPKLMSINVCFNNAVAKLFRKELVNNLRFDTSIKYGEDLDFYFSLYLNVESVSYVDELTYVYRIHGDSTTSNFNQEYAEQELSIFKKMFKKIQEIGLPTIHYFNKFQKLLKARVNYIKNKVLLNEHLDFLKNIEGTVTYPNTLISVVIPIYNVSPYLRLCLESIENQTYPYFEVLLVNDGSRDNSEDICQEFINKDKRFRYFEQENLGLSAARNTGILNSKGEFITFIEGDDFVVPNYLAELYQSALKNDSEIVIGSYKKFNENDNNYYIHVFDYKEEHFNQNELIQKREIEFETSWGILFHKRLFEMILFPVGKSIGDCFTNFKLFMESCKASYIHKDLYIHRIRKGSLSALLTEKYFTDIFEALLERIATLALLGIDISEEKRTLIDRLQLQYKQMSEAGFQETEIFRRYKEFLYLVD